MAGMRLIWMAISSALIFDDGIVRPNKSNYYDDMRFFDISICYDNHTIIEDLKRK